MFIEYGPVFSRVLERTRDEWDQFRNALVAPTADGKSREIFFNKDGYFPSGLIGHLQRAGLTLDGSPTPDELPTVPSDLLKGAKLRAYQVRAVRKFMSERRGIIAHATGSGKTLQAAAIIQLVGGPTLGIVDSENAAVQLVAELKKFGVESVTQFGGGRKKIGRHVICVSNSAYRHARRQSGKLYEFMQTAKLLLADEAHHIGTAATWVEAANACPAPYRLGLSATPMSEEFCSNDLRLLGVLGDVIDVEPSKSLRDQEYLSEPFVFLLDASPGPKVHPKITDWNRIEKQGIVENDYRNSLAASAILAVKKADPNMRALVLVRLISHGELLLKVFNQLGIKTWFSSGQRRLCKDNGQVTSMRYDKVKQHLVDGDFDALIATVVYDEAFDLPALTDVVLAAAGRKTRRLMQRLGRGERRSEGKQYVRVWDFWDGQHWATKAQSMARRKVFDAEEITVIDDKQVILDVLWGRVSLDEVVLPMLEERKEKA